ncbi:MAG: Ig-like domain-containing protein [Lacibacter sp.]
MKHTAASQFLPTVLLALLLILAASCRRDVTNLQPPSYPAKGEVFLNDFTSDLAYSAFGTSDVTAFSIDYKEAYGNVGASMRFNVPDANSTNGSYAGGVFYSTVGRNLSGFNALTFYIKASQPATIGTLGFGDDLGESRFKVTLNGLPVTTNWKKVIIPIPDPSKLTQEKGMLFYAADPENGRGYTFWIDEVKFEKVGGLAYPTGQIYEGQTNNRPAAENGDTYQIDGLRMRVNLPTGVDQLVSIAPHYFTFVSTDSTIASVNATGLVRVLRAGTATISAWLANQPAEGALVITSIGNAILPTTPAPTPPARDAADVISLFSNAYTNVPVTTWNTRWQFSTAENSFIQIAGNDAIRYRFLNFVGIEFTNPTINASAMRFLHMDIWTPNPTALPNNFKILLVDFGPNNVFGGGDDAQHEITITAPTLVSNNWVSIDVPLTAFTGLTRRANLAQMVLSGTLPDVVVDNIYFYRNPAVPPVAAPVPNRPAANVLSIFSDSYTNVPGTDFFPNWGQTTVVTQVPIAGNNTLRYTNFNYQGIQLGSNIDVSSYGFLHLDYYTTTASQLRVFLISPGPVETPYSLTVPTAGWNSVDIPLTAFAPVALNNVFQFKFDLGNGDEVYLDNIYFWRIPAVPTTAAPTPTFPAGDVISIFSDSYTNVPGTDFFPNWGQNTVVTQVPIAGNNTLLYTNLNYQGTQFGSPQNVSGMNFLHFSYYSANSTALEVFLISPGPQQRSFVLQVPTSQGWNTVNIPLSAFTPTVNLNEVFQMMFVGNGNIYIDNILFRR